MTQTQHSLIDYAAAVRAGDIADVCDRLIDMQLERLAWLDRKPKPREPREAKAEQAQQAAGRNFNAE